MLGPVLNAAAYHVARRSASFRPAPLNLTFSVSYRCNARCRTCNVWKKRVDDLSLDEYKRLFDGIGRNLYWATFSGGEPFLRPDLPDIVLECVARCGASLINIPTNGLLQKRVIDGVRRMSQGAPEARFIINFSLDGIGKRHDELRGVPGNYDRLRATYEELKACQLPNVTLGIHAVVSKHNVTEIPALRAHARAVFAPDSFITEVAEERLELDTIGEDITPTPSEYAPVVDDLLTDLDANPARGIAGLTQAFRREYYKLAHQTLLEQRQVLPCYAGIASAHVAPNGDVWTCCTRAESIGNLREHDFDFMKVWRSHRGEELRDSIRRGECSCPLANAAYSSMLCEPAVLARVGVRWLASQLRPSASAPAEAPQEVTT